MVKLPLTEGRAKDLDLFHIYTDPFILYVYAISIAFFVGMYQAFKLLGYLRVNDLNLLQVLKALRKIRYCAIIFSVLIVIAGLYIKLFHAKDDDPAGFLTLCFLITLLSIAVVLIAVKQENKLKIK
jgi:hypothetical protein